MKRSSYRSLLQQRIIIAGLTLGLVTVMIGVLIDLTATGQRTTIPATTQRLIQPLNPQLDLAIIERLERFEFVSIDEAKEGVRLPSAPLIATPQPTVEPQLDQSLVSPVEETGAFVETETTAPSPLPTEPPASTDTASDLTTPSL